jgi:plastocyanin
LSRSDVRAAPVRHLLRIGAALVLALAACDRVALSEDEPPPILELAHDTIQLAAGVKLHEVRVERTDSGEFHPGTIDASTGDVVRFAAHDRGSHAIAFDGNRLDPAARSWLDATGQMRSPPLIAAGSTWIITLEDAPPGEYPFRCATHDVGGRLRVSGR